VIKLGIASSGYAFTNLLSSPDNHAAAAWGSGSGWTASISDVDGGSTAEQWVEHSGSGTRDITQNAISTSTGSHIMELYYKQKSGSDSARRLLFEIGNYPAWSSGLDLTLDETGTVIDYSTYGSAFTAGTAQSTVSTNSFFRVTATFTTTATSLIVYAQHRNDSSATYTGDGASGWIIDNHRLYKI